MKTINILLVEDNEGDIVLTLEALKDFKVLNQVSVVRDGRQALEYIENSGMFNNQQEPDLVLLDVNLPKINGHEVLSKIKNNDAKKHIPIVMLTTSSSQTDVLKSYKNHANCYIVKPVDVTDFNRVLASIENFWFSVVQLPKPL
ncbi:MAG TPA: response regulator [Flavobacterium sp.]|jgi:CheY-like chemotaxis protein